MSAMDSVIFNPFVITLDNVGRFERDGGNIWWVSVKHPPKALLTLQYDLTDKLTAVGFKLDKRKYTPHITLGREVVTDTEPWEIKPFGQTVAKIDLMKSEHVKGKLTYTAIHSKGAVK
jgi:2'-5' RNA ligase